MKRRNFIKNTALASSLFYVPSFVNAFNSLDFNLTGFKRLVIVQLSGGNDGLNTVIPYNNDIYYKNRPSINIKNDILKLNNELALHPNLAPIKNLYDQGYLTIVNNVGYPNPNRSHFRATDIWQTASGSNEYLSAGWLGRYLDIYGKNPYNAIEVDDSLSLVMKGNKLNGMAVQNANQLYQNAQDPYFKKVLENHTNQHLSEDNLGYLYKTMIAAENSAKYIYNTTKTYNSTQTYPENPLAKQLKTAAEFINSGLDCKVLYTSLGGFDTHFNQKARQEKLLSVYAESIAAFVKDLQVNNTFKDTLILTFSEFGRRVKQNAANGTDHGTANNVFIIGENLKQKGIYNEAPNLNDLDENGDLKYSVDFRSIYATILQNWMHVDDKSILNETFKPLSFL
ncbi:DUF1501 domain-containing protein [Lutibacter sp. HS1-25]|uniref:DUF1501 domain-containing protein n=1 Tax=Lutibacter sp. HS1-25 TaxID=2485000 RepID=UPI0010106BFF|nr:DUF1501 domain-containing protein [Lutibacter sp. HS1-25]RXP45932.1 DUF1501 domain-containing protein [Lutibacter sp. HS1-25]